MNIPENLILAMNLLNICLILEVMAIKMEMIWILDLIVIWLEILQLDII